MEDVSENSVSTGAAPSEGPAARNADRREPALYQQQRDQIALRAEARLTTTAGRFSEAQFWAQAAFERLSKSNLRSAVEAGQTQFIDDNFEDKRDVLNELQKAQSFLEHARRELDEAIQLAKR